MCLHCSRHNHIICLNDYLQASKADSPERPTPPRQQDVVKVTDDDGTDDFDDEPDETISERLWGLTEMFPEPVRKLSGAVTHLTLQSVKGLYGFTCNASWIFFTSSMILFAPVIFETERATMEEMQRSQQKQVLLGTGGGGVGPGGMPGLPPM